MLKDSDIVNQFNKTFHFEKISVNWKLQYSFLLECWLNLGEPPILDFRKTSQLFPQAEPNSPGGVGGPKTKKININFVFLAILSMLVFQGEKFIEIFRTFLLLMGLIISIIDEM